MSNDVAVKAQPAGAIGKYRGRPRAKRQRFFIKTFSGKPKKKESDRETRTVNPKKIFDPTDPLFDRRKFTRVYINTVTRFFCPTCTHESGIQTRICDVSEGGAFLVTFHQGIPLDTKVTMSFLLPDKTPALIPVEGLVRHTGHLENDLYRSGIEFTKIKEKDRKLIREFVAARKKEEK